MKVSYIIVDDEPLAHDVIMNYGAMLPHVELKKNCYNAMEAMEYLHSHTVDMMFLDLNMPKIRGFEFLRTLVTPPAVIVTTAYKEYAVEGYELNVVDYLVKPFSFERFVKAVNKASGVTPANTASATPTAASGARFFIKADKRYHQVFAGDILYVEAYGNYAKVVMEEGTIVSHEKISTFEELLPGDSFMRVHKSFIVALNRISQIEGNRIRVGQNEIPVGQTYRSAVSKLYN